MTDIFSLSFCRSQTNKSLREEVKDIAMDDPLRDMKKKVKIQQISQT